jgi:lysozyme
MPTTCRAAIVDKNGINPAQPVSSGGIRLFLERKMSRLTASRAALDLIASFEGFRARAAKTPDGRWTLGFGHVATAREGLSVSRAEAEDLLRWDLRPVEDMVRQSALTPLNQNQFDALVSFAFNIGVTNFATSDVLRYLNQGQPIAAALAMHAWRRARVNGRVLVIDALVRRRAAEAALFLEPLGPRPAAPSSVLSPEIDYTAALLTHASDPRDITLGVEADGATIATEPSESMLPEKPKGEPFPIKTVAETASVAEVKAAPVLDFSSEINDEPRLVLVENEPAEENKAADEAVEETLDPVLAPFPKEEAVAANQSDQSQPVPANDGLRTLAPFAPEMDLASEPSIPGSVSVPRPQILEPAAPTRVLTWVVLALGAVFLAGGLWFAHLMGALTPDPEAKVISLQALMAILSACFGFVAVVTSAVSLARGQESGDETALLP